MSDYVGMQIVSFLANFKFSDREKKCVPTYLTKQLHSNEKNQIPTITNK